MSSQAPQSFSNRSACARPAHLRNPTPPPSSAPPAKTCPPAPEGPRRSSPDLQIPIGRARQTSPLPSRGFLLRGLSDAGPKSPHHPPQRGRRPSPSAPGKFSLACQALNHAPSIGLGGTPVIRQDELPANLVSRGRDPAIPNHDPSIREKEFRVVVRIFPSYSALMGPRVSAETANLDLARREMKAGLTPLSFLLRRERRHPSRNATRRRAACEPGRRS